MKKGFTIIELLGVIAILAIIIALILPVFSKIEGSGQGVVDKYEQKANDRERTVMDILERDEWEHKVLGTRMLNHKYGWSHPLDAVTYLNTETFYKIRRLRAHKFGVGVGGAWLIDTGACL